MDRSWGELVRLLWNEMNPIEEYTSPEANARVNKITGESKASVFKNNINNIRSIGGGDVKLPFLTRANAINGNTIIPNGNKLMEAYVVPEEYVKYIRKGSDRILNRIPNVTMGKMVNKMLSSPITQGISEKVVLPLSVIEMMGFNNPAY